MTAGAWRDGWFVVPHDIPFRDLDYFGHVNNALYFTYFELARTLLWFSITGGTKPDDIGFIVAHAECDFRLSLGMEPIDIAVRISETRNTSIDFVYEVRRVGGEVAATGKVVVVLFDWETRTKRAISDELREKIRALSS
ncbi:MAG: acyl-CoA thioesterase [Acidobacteria bacterium]|nr:acyl-CoA thioesterase [Acidobacteriota bacterium]